jgi:outer membrane protein assembly factor BamD (BamD/ComL family)
VDSQYKLKSLILLLFIGLFFTTCNKQIADEEPETELELEFMNKGSAYLDEGNYSQAQMLYSQFIVKYPTHPYVDDAAYRLAYISVIADEENPYFDYKNGQMQFQNFIENYPNSRYINACQNWINLLKTVNKLTEIQAATEVGDGTNSTEINRLKNELKRVKAENSKLKNTLEELQKAIER